MLDSTPAPRLKLTKLLALELESVIFFAPIKQSYILNCGILGMS